ncbi:MAG TPA: hypothetical protein VFA12_20040 [Stellaceae bacterium]|nr:hypothetical protein [Stellaceae bacterium]
MRRVIVMTLAAAALAAVAERAIAAEPTPPRVEIWVHCGGQAPTRLGPGQTVPAGCQIIRHHLGKERSDAENAPSGP